MTEALRGRSIVASARWLWAAVVIVAASANTSAQLRPAIPEVRCTGVSLVVTRVAGRREVGLRVVNTDPGDFRALLRPEIEVLQDVGGRWQRVSVAGLLLRSACTSEPRECVALAPRAALTVVPWSGMLGDGQCVCTRCYAAPAGRYRFRVTTCEHCQGPVSFESEPFTLDAP